VPEFVRPIHCAFCFEEMDPESEQDPWDPLEVIAESRDGEESYVFNAHRSCLVAAWHPMFRDPEIDEILARFGNKRQPSA
jgi:hypothetical protein